MSVQCCPDHGDLMLELALGRLDEGDGVRAEALRATCAGCRQWWESTFDEPSLAAVDAAVVKAFAGFRAPRRLRSGWWTAAAAALLVLAIGSASLLWRAEGTTTIASQPSATSDTVLSAWDFENGALTAAAAPAGREVIVQSSGDAEGAVFTNDLESGDLASWSFHS